MEDFKIINVSDGFAYGYLIPKESPTTEAFLANLRDYNNIDEDHHKQIKLCNQIYRNEGVIATALDVLIEFAVDEMSIKELNTKTKQIVDWWLDNINLGYDNVQKGLKQFNSQCAIDYFVSGNPFIYKNWQIVKTPFGDKELPMGLILLNPAFVNIPKESLNFGRKLIFYKPSEEVIQLLTQKKRKMTAEEKLKFDSIPDDFKKQVDPEHGILLDNSVVEHLKRKGRNYLAWGEPFLVRTFSAVAHKKKLQLLDQATTEGLINMIYLFKIGDKDNPATWSSSRISAFRNLLRKPSSTHAIVWAYDIEVETVGPEGQVLNFNSKYEQANIDILRSLGIPMSIFTGESKGDQYLATAVLLERLDEFRDLQGTFLKDLIKEIIVRNNLEDSNPRIIWKNSRIRNERELRELVVTLRDRGLISIETTLEEAGQDIELEKTRKKNEKSIEPLFAPPEMPFSTPKLPRKSPDNSGEKNNTTNSPKQKSTLKDNSKAEIESSISSMYDKELQKLTIKNKKENDPIKIYLNSLELPIKTELFIKALLNNRDNFGINIDSLLEDRFTNLKDKFINKLQKISKDKNFKELIDREIAEFSLAVSKLISESLSDELQ